MFAFAKTPNDALAGLAKQLDKLVADNQEKKLAAVINFIGEPNDETMAKIAEFGQQHSIQNVALTVTADAQKFKVNDAAELTVMCYKGKKVVANHAVGSGGLDEAAVKGIVGGVNSILD